MRSITQEKVIELHRVRFEHFYNGVLTLDIHYCTYDCLFCFSKEGRYKVEENLDSGKIRKVYLKDIYFFDENKEHNENRVNFNENSKIHEEFFEKEFGISDDKNNLIPKKYIGEIIIITSTRTLVEKIKHILKLKNFPIKSIRFSSGDIVNSEFLDWFNEFIVEFFNKFQKENLILIIETNGSRFNLQKDIDPTFAKFLELLKDETYKEKIHLRISLKNPNDAFYRVLTKKGDNLKLKRAIDFGIHCLKNNISFHYTIFANYLSIDDLIQFKKLILQKLDVIDKSFFKDRFDNKEDAFNHIFKLIEYERLFYYKTNFKEYLVAYYFIKGDYNLKKYIEDFEWSKKLREMASIYKLEFNGRHKAYYKRFLNRTVPKFKKNGFSIFENDLIQHKKLLKIYEEYISLQETSNLKVDEKQRESNSFDGYKGILDFWELAFGSRFLHYRPYKGKLTLNLKFQNVSIVNRIPLYPGIFYLYDFWAQSKPNYFIYTLYAEREYMKLKNDEYYVYSINSNPDTHAHTDISRAIPILIKKSKFGNEKANLIDDLEKNHVIDIEDLELELKNILNYVINFENFEINVPFFILELKIINYNSQKIKSTPFLGSIGALYDNLLFYEKYTPYLNYFYWTGIKYDKQVNPSFRKAIKYLFEFQSIQKDEEDMLDWLQLKIIEPKDEILELLKLKSKLDENMNKFIIENISQCIDYIKEYYINRDNAND